jgi:hypothetical protein
MSFIDEVHHGNIDIKCPRKRKKKEITLLPEGRRIS